ncbi:MAG: SpoVA/SpoVAEb family sporulation membrane protein [Candidatus Borkfalkiaceae bacterium]|nr:SpoVA/SpoVAEb family sporulation membrane protein [Christensenellaceae bacterium]
MEITLSFIKAFVVGGAICTIAQLLINYTKITSGKILVYFLLSGVFLQSIGVYQYLVDFAGAGATVPISGFGYLLADGAMKGAEKSLFDAITGGLKAASMGITAAVVFGYVFALIFKPRSKKN